MTMDIAMGGSTNTILHLLAVANEAGVDFKMADIDRLSRVVPCICKTAPNNHDYYMEDVHRAGGHLRHPERIGQSRQTAHRRVHHPRADTERRN